MFLNKHGKGMEKELWYGKFKFMDNPKEKSFLKKWKR